MTLEELIKLKLERLETIPNLYNENIRSTQKDIMLDLIDSLELLVRDENGNIKKTQKNLLIIEDISIDLKEIFGKSDYIKLTEDFIKEFDEQAKITDEFYYKLFGSFDDNTFNLKALEKAKKQAFELMASTPIITTNLYQPVKSLLTNAVITGDAYSKTIKAIKQVVQGGTINDKKLEGKLYRYARQMSIDTFSVADRGYTNNIALDLKIDWYVYSGGIVKDSREFCIERNGKYYHREEVKAWAKLSNWDGRIPSTDEKTIFIYCGGFQCYHSILPTSVAVVPKDILERNIQSGNYSPSDKERKILGL